MARWLIRAAVKLLLRLRWAYFHIHPGYVKFYMDREHKEAHFQHLRTNSIHSDFSFSDPVDQPCSTPSRWGTKWLCFLWHYNLSSASRFVDGIGHSLRAYGITIPFTDYGVFVIRRVKTPDPSMVASEEAGLEHQEKVQADEPANEKSRRVYYQDIVYSVCNDLDKLLPGITVCGSWAEPSTQVQDRMKVLRKVLAHVPAKVLMEAKEKADCPTLIVPAECPDSV